MKKTLMWLQQTQRISSKQASELLQKIIRFGDHFEDGYRYLSEAQLREQLDAENYPWLATVEALRRDPNAHIERFTNMTSLSLGRYFQSNVEGGAVEVSTLRSDGSVLTSTTMSKPDRIYIGPEWMAFLGDALRAYTKALKESDRTSAHSMLVNGFAAIEALLNIQAHFYILDNPNTPFHETGMHMSLKDKLTVWIPRMTGCEIDLGDVCWESIVRLSDTRNDGAVHPKPGHGLTSLTGVAASMNDFQSGICVLIYRLLFIFGERIPDRLIRTIFDAPVTVGDRRPE